MSAVDNGRGPGDFLGGGFPQPKADFLQHVVHVQTRRWKDDVPFAAVESGRRVRFGPRIFVVDRVAFFSGASVGLPVGVFCLFVGGRLLWAMEEGNMLR